MKRKRVGVLITGFFLHADGWRDVVWGSPENGIWGRASLGIRYAIEENADLVYWGTGASEKDGFVESRYTARFAEQRLQQRELFPSAFDGSEQYLTWMFQHGVCDTESRHTPGELKGFLAACAQNQIEKAVVVSDPTHIARTLQEAMKARDESECPQIELVAIPSDVSYPGYGPGDVLVVEPPHRKDRSSVPVHVTLKQVMRELRKPDSGSAYNDVLLQQLEEWKDLSGQSQ